MTQSANAGATFDRLAVLARQRSYFFSDIWQRSRTLFGEAWVEEFVDNIDRLFGREAGGWEAAVDGYAEFALDAVRNQKYFEANRTYRYHSLAEIEGRFYRSEAHMMRNYLPGMFLSHYLWPHHFRLLTFFREQILPAVPAGTRRFYDVGIGTGVYSREVMRALPEVKGTGFDISEYSIAFTRNLLAAFGLADRYEFVYSNIYTAPLPEQKADFLVSQECLEHLEDPQRFCEILFALTRQGGRAYITAAINAAHSDHIYLFHSPDEVRALLEGVGWRVKSYRAEYAYADKPSDLTPCVAGFLCER